MPDALVIPAGGPGFSGAGAIGWNRTSFGAQRDIVLYDQRGTGGAVPNLDCPTLDQAFVAALQAAGSYADERDAMATARRDCLTALEAQGVDLSDYHSEASAADLDELRHALGYQQWNILGISYGGRLALATLRTHPEGIRAVILDSVFDVTYGGLASLQTRVERAFRRLADGCAADPSCASAHGDLNAKFEQLQRQYNAAPAVINVDLGDGHGAQQFVITGDDLMAALFMALYNPALIPALPSIIDQLLDGQTAIITTFVQGGVPFATAAADAMTVAVNCADNAGLNTLDADTATYQDPGRLSLLASMTGICPPDWPSTPGQFNNPVTSEVPALVLAGSYDPVIPPAGTEQVARRLPNSTFVLVDPAGHGVTGYHPCIEGIQLAFLEDPTTAPDTACAAAIPPAAFQ